MKFILPFITALLFAGFFVKAQTNDTVFKKQWVVIDSLIIEKGLPKSALGKVNTLFDQAKSKNLPAQVIKALLYKLSLEGQVNEDDINKVAQIFDAEIAGASGEMERSILQVLKAAALESYFNERYWQLRNRSTSINYKKTDITTWGAADFYSAISELYSQALMPVQRLQQTGTQQYGAIIIRGNTPLLRPTLYDLLANLAIDFYKDENRYGVENQALSAPNDIAAPLPLNNFIAQDFSSADTVSYMSRILLLYQSLERFHAAHNDTAALVDADINRINWVHDNAGLAKKDVYYKTALEAITQQYPNHPQAAQAWYLLLNMQAERARSYKPFEDTAGRYAFVPVREKILERLKTQPAKSEGNSNMQQLLAEIEGKALHTEAESVNVPGQPFRLLVQYKNVDTLYGRIVDKKLVDGLRGNGDEQLWKKVKSLKYIRSFEQLLPQTNDYQQHRVEIKMDALPAGEYVLLGSSTKGFIDSAGRLLTQEFTVSHLSYIHNGNDYFVLDRESGKPLKGVNVILTLNHYSYNAGNQGQTVLPPFTSGKDGYFAIPASVKLDNYGYLSIALKDGNDVLPSLNRDYYNTSAGNGNSTAISNLDFEKKSTTVHLYVDRAIYRPGQKVFFKGIAITEDAVTHQPKLYKTADSLRVYLKDVNSKTVDSVSLLLNRYGSISGSFVPPPHALTGNFRLEMKDIEGWQTFRVEEYKRPTFYVQLDTLKSAYRLRDTITVAGFAQAFAGNFLNNAQVKYTIERAERANFYTWYRGITPGGGNKQIAEGTVTTDGSGRFTIKFLALPDETEDSNLSPIFNFAINATVTDAGGETREANTSLSVGYASVIVKLNVPAIVEKNGFSSLAVSVQNLAEKPIAATVHIRVYPLQTPGRPVRKRYWERPDVFVMDKDEFVRNFPFDEYENESDSRNWHITADSTKDTFNTTALISAYSLKHAMFNEGKYLIVASTTDDNGHEVFNAAYTEVYDSSSVTVPANDANFNFAANTVLQPGSKASLSAGSVFSDVYVIQQVDKVEHRINSSTGSQAYKTFVLDGNKKTMEEPVTEADRGGFGIYYAFVKHNRVYTGGSAFEVPWDNKHLDVQYTSFRNKTEPGSKEQWTINIKGADTGKAELLTAMYDASLDQFARNSWYAPNVWKKYQGFNNWQGSASFGNDGSSENEDNSINIAGFDIAYDRLATAGEDLLGYGSITYTLENAKIGTINQEGMKMDYAAAPPPAPMARSGAPGLLGATQFRYSPNVAMAKFTAPQIVSEDYDKEFKSVDFIDKNGDHVVNGRIIHPNNNPSAPLQIRKNFNETGFFFPQVYADSAGNYNIQFTMPESLTKWKWVSLAHTQGLSFGTNEQTIITQKTLMVQPNMPRFLREGDQIELTARISNTGDTALSGQVSLELVDAATGNPVDGLFQNIFPNQYFTAEAGQTTVVKFPVVIPNNYYHPLTYRVIAKTNGFNDGEENTLPVLTNRMLVTESLPLYIKGDTTKHFSFDKLLNNNSETLQTQSLTVEYTANPVWTAIQSLPYLMEYPYECAEQTFNRYYGNTLAAFIIKQHPRIKEVFHQWMKTDSSGAGALASALQKNEALKQVILSETPWVLDAQNETQQKHNIALLFDAVTMGHNTQSALQKLQDMQLPDGSFAWFKGGTGDRYITQYILTGIGRLQLLHALPEGQSVAFNAMVDKALDYLDGAANKDYNDLLKYKAKLADDHLSYSAIQYLFMRSYFSAVIIKNKTAYNYYYQQAMQYWQRQGVYMKGMVALALLRTGQEDYVVKNIYPSIIENAVATPERGMYWKDNQWGYYWYQAPIEQQALLIELAEAMPPAKAPHAQRDADELKTWLINQKQTTNWATTKATADACYALLLNSSTQIDANRVVTIQLGSLTIKSSDEKAEAGTGYFKQVIDGKDVEPTMGNITASVHTDGAVKNTSPSWGAVYWQYLEDMDKITGAVTPLQLHKQLFTERNTANGKVLTPVTNDSVLHVGDKVVVRIELKSDRDMEYLHLKDMRAASMEPQNVLSGYKWQDGLGYYESTKDAATDFFISYLPKGTYVFEYPVFITHIGTFSSGIATIQCMYAPEFTGHSEGIKIVVE